MVPFCSHQNGWYMDLQSTECWAKFVACASANLAEKKLPNNLAQPWPSKVWWSEAGQKGPLGEPNKVWRPRQPGSLMACVSTSRPNQKQTQTSRRSRSLVGRFVFVFLRMKARSSLKTCFLCLPRSGGSTVFSFWERDAYCFYKTNIWGSGGVRPAVGSKTERLFRILSQNARFSWDKNNSIVVLLDALGNIYRQCWT